MKLTAFSVYLYIIFIAGYISVSCVPGPVKFKEQQPLPPPTAPEFTQAEKNLVINRLEENIEQPVEMEPLNDPYGLYRKRREIPVSMNKYEGSLWKGDSSFGNFMRDNRAQSLGELLQITDIQKMVTQFEEEPIEIVQDLSSDADVFKIGEAERLKVHKGISEMTVKIVNVNPSGLMAIYGEISEFKDSNNTRYNTKLMGYIRPEDVTEENTLPADKIQSFRFITDRKVKLNDTLRRQIIENIKNLETLNDNSTVSANSSGTVTENETIVNSTDLNNAVQVETVETVVTEQIVPVTPDTNPAGDTNNANNPPNTN